MPSTAELLGYTQAKSQQEAEDLLYRTSKYTGPTHYHKLEIAQYHHPNAFVNTIFRTNQHTQFTGVAVIGPPGHGKNTVVECLVHHMHLKKPEFLVKWAGDYEFTHQKEFYESLPKRPHIIIFDDVTGALQQMGEKKAGESFNALTKIRHTLGVGNKVIVFILFHYTKNIPKEFRAQFGYKVYTALGDEEVTNLHQIYDRHSRAFMKLKQYAKVYQTMMENDEFELNVAPNKKAKFTTDYPFRCACIITLTKAHFLLFAKDNCTKCAKYETIRFLEPQLVLAKIRQQYGIQGLQALRLEMFHKGYYEAIPANLGVAWDFVRNKVLNKYSTDYPKLIDEIFKISKVKRKKRLYHKRKEEEEILEDFEKNIKEVRISGPSYNRTELDDKITDAMNSMFL